MKSDGKEIYSQDNLIFNKLRSFSIINYLKRLFIKFKIKRANEN